MLTWVSIFPIDHNSPKKTCDRTDNGHIIYFFLGYKRCPTFKSGAEVYDVEPTHVVRYDYRSLQMDWRVELLYNFYTTFDSHASEIICMTVYYESWQFDVPVKHSQQSVDNYEQYHERHSKGEMSETASKQSFSIPFAIIHSEKSIAIGWGGYPESISVFCEEVAEASVAPEGEESPVEGKDGQKW